MKNDFNAVGLLCSWGMHSHNKEIVLASPDIDFKFTVNVCPKCKQPSKRTLKLLLGNGNYRINEELFHNLSLFLGNIVSGESYGENTWCYQTRTAKELLINLQGDLK